MNSSQTEYLQRVTLKYHAKVRAPSTVEDLQESSVTDVGMTRVDNGISYLVADHHESYAIIPKARELYPQVLVLINHILDRKSVV